MKEFNYSFARFIDKYREDRKITREDFLSEIVSISQFKRYLNGEQAIPFDKLILMVQKLNMSMNDLQYAFMVDSDYEYNKVRRIYKMIIAKDFKGAYEEIKKYRTSDFYNNYNKNYFIFCNIYVQYSLNMISRVYALEEYTKLINYPKCLEKNNFTFLELISILKIANLNVLNKNYEIADKLYNILINEDIYFTSGDETLFMPHLYEIISKIYGIKGEDNKVLILTNKGIEYTKRSATFNGLSHLYYYNALANLHLNNKIEGLKSAQLCFYTCTINGNKNEYKMFEKDFEKEFKMTVKELLKMDF